MTTPDWDQVTFDLGGSTDPMVLWQQWRLPALRQRTPAPRIQRLLRLKPGVQDDTRADLLHALAEAGWRPVWPTRSSGRFLCMEYIGDGVPERLLLGEYDALDGEVVAGDVFHHDGGGL